MIRSAHGFRNSRAAPRIVGSRIRSRQVGVRATSAPVRCVLRPVKSSPPNGVRSMNGVTSLTMLRSVAASATSAMMHAPSRCIVERMSSLLAVGLSV